MTSERLKAQGKSIKCVVLTGSLPRELLERTASSSPFGKSAVKTLLGEGVGRQKSGLEEWLVAPWTSERTVVRT